MADLTLTGSLNVGINKVSELISASATFQTLTGAANAAAALAFIKQYSVPEDDITFPLALVDMTDDYDSTSIAGGAGQTFRSAYKVFALIGLPIPAGQINADGTVDVRNAQVYMANQVGAIIAEIKAAAGTTNSMRIANILASAPMLSAEMSRDDQSGSILLSLELD